MSETGFIKWIKIKTYMFDDNKIKVIRKMPEGDAIVSIWVHLICLAGVCNARGMIYLTEGIPYTDESLATVMSRELNTVRLALDTLSRLNMIEWENGKRLVVVNFERHQSIEGMERAKELNKERQQKYRDKQKMLELTGVKDKDPLHPPPPAPPADLLLPREPSDDMKEIIKLYENNIAMAGVNSVIYQKIEAEIKEGTPVDWIKRAIKEAATANAKSWRYIEKCIDNWKATGYPTDKGDRGNGTAKVTPRAIKQQLPKQYTDPKEFNKRSNAERTKAASLPGL